MNNLDVHIFSYYIHIHIKSDLTCLYGIKLIQHLKFYLYIYKQKDLICLYNMKINSTSKINITIVILCLKKIKNKIKN